MPFVAAKTSPPQVRRRLARWLVNASCPVLVIGVLGCAATATTPPSGGRLSAGTWGGDSAAVMVTDTLTHVHVGCSYGDVPGRITIGDDGRFTAVGSYLLRAYPIAVGPTMPAQFTGVLSGAMLTMTVTVTDTVARMVVVRGPVSVRLGATPVMQNCPVCRVVGERAPKGRMRIDWVSRLRIAALLEREAVP